jgi:hypothetical protein
MIASIKERYKPTLKQKLSVFEMSSAAEIAAIIVEMSNTHRREDYILIKKWVIALGENGREQVKFKLQARKSTSGIALLDRVFEHM